MEAAVGKAVASVLVGTLGYARSKAAEEVALQLGVDGDVTFIADELEMMQSFLMTADEERGQQKVLATWVKHVRDMAYNVEDSLMDFSLLSEKKKSWWRSAGTIVERHRIAMEMKKLRAKVEDVSNRNMRYRLIKESSTSKPAAAEEQASIATAAMFGINEARLGTLGCEKQSEVDLHQLITSNDADLRVIAMWGTSGELGKTSAIQEVYNDPNVLKLFGFRAWIRLMHTFNPKEFLQNLLWQFYENPLDGLGKTEHELVHYLNAQVSSNSYLIVIDNLSTIVDWSCIKRFFPDNKKRSRIIVSTQQAEIASLCTEQPYQVSELKQLSYDQTLYLFHMKINSEEQATMASASAEIFDINEPKVAKINSEEQVTIAGASAERSGINEPELATVQKVKSKDIHGSCSAAPILDSSKITTTEKDRTMSTTEIQEEDTTMSTTEIQEEDPEPKDAGEDKVSNSTAKKFDRSTTLALADEVICGRETDKSIVIKLIGQPDDRDDKDTKVISVWGVGGLGKTTLVRSIYRSQQLGGWKRAWATALRPFNLEVFLRYLALQFQKSIQEDPAGGPKNRIAVMKLQELKEELARLLKNKNCLVVLDDISSTSEWNLVKGCLANAQRSVWIVTTREKNIAEYCSGVNNMYSLGRLKDDAALDLFINKVFKDNTGKTDLVPAMMEQARLVLKKCDGLPLAISTIGALLATKPKTAMEWRRMNDRISSELVMSPELMPMKTVLMRSYDDLPYHLKSLVLYLCIFPEHHIIRWGRLVRRWIAEGYSRDMHGMSAEELGRRYFDELLDRSIILPGEEVNHHNGKIISCQLHPIIREICLAKARDENLIFTLEEGSCLNSTQGAIRHLVIGSNRQRNKDVLESRLDLSHVRSLTVFGKWRPFHLSKNMRFLRVLDLEDTLGLRDHHLNQIGQHLHLMYLSLRGCQNILYLPHSLENLRHLQALDVRGTRILELPATIIKLHNLRYLRTADYLEPRDIVKEEDDIVYKYKIYTNCFLCTVPLFLRPQALEDGLNRHDICNLYRHSLNRHLRGVEVPRGIGKLKALNTLGGVDVAWGKWKDTIKDLEELTQLCKLGVIGIYNRNRMEFWTAIAGYNQLQSLSVIRDNRFKSSELDDCLSEHLSPPSCLESLKLSGKLVKLTKWIHQLQNLSKLELAYSELQDGDIRALGLLPNLVVLCLKQESFMQEQLLFEGRSFPSLMVLELYYLESLELVFFGKDSMPKLEVLQAEWCRTLETISGLPELSSLRQIRLGSGVPKLKTAVQSQLAEHLTHVRLNIM